MKKSILHIMLMMLLPVAILKAQATHGDLHTTSDQQIYITGEDIWVDVSFSGDLGSARTMRVRLVDRNMISKAEVEIVPGKNTATAFMTIPENLVSDYYFIDAYVRGIGSKTFMTPIMVINPKMPPGVCPNSSLAPLGMKNSSTSLNLSQPPSTSTSSTPSTSSTASTLTIQLPKQQYAPREEVKATIIGTELLTQLHAVVIREDALSIMMRNIISQTPSSIISHASNGSIEGEGHVITAKVMSDGKPVVNFKMSASLKGSRSTLATGTTDEEGMVRFILPVYFGNASLVVSPLDKRSQKPIVEILGQQTNTRAIEFPCLKLDESMRDDIESRIFNSRVNSRFYGDAARAYAIPDRDTTDFYGKPDERYMLDDYVRFPNMEEVIAEIIPPLRVKKENGVQMLQVLNLPNKSFFDIEPLVLVDGVPHQNAKEIIETDPLLVKSIDVVTRKYYIGEVEFSGIVHFKTYRGDRALLRLSDQDLITTFKGVQESATVQPPVFSASNQRMPDNRNLLLKEQLVNADATGKINLQFNTSDATGNYKIIVRGQTKDGKEVSAAVVIAVK